jgi:hypothetical protein
MNRSTKTTLISALVSLAVVSTVAVAGNVTLPYSFTASTTAKAAEVNANFAAVKTANDDNQTQITALSGRVTNLELRPCPVGRTAVGDRCLEIAARTADTWLAAGAICFQQGGSLCSAQTLYYWCTTGAMPGSTTNWTSDPVGYSGGVQVLLGGKGMVGFLPGSCGISGPAATGATVNEYRCCFNR